MTSMSLIIVSTILWLSEYGHACGGDEGRGLRDVAVAISC